jgi:hypothetical protein
MPVQRFTDGIEPKDPDTPILRFMERWKFEHLLKGRLYFRRADLFEDESEGLPLDEYWQTLNLDPHDLNDIQKRNYHLGFDAQIRQSYFIGCWYQGINERVRIWRDYAKGNGVAVCSTYARLKTALDVLPAEDRAMLGLVRYGNAHLVPGRVNLMINVSTKQLKYADEQEVRAMLWLVDPHETGNRHIDIDNRFHPRPIYPTSQPEGVYRPVDLNALVTGVILSPFADAGALAETRELIAKAGYSFSVTPSALTSGAHLLPTADELRRYR